MTSHSTIKATLFLICGLPGSGKTTLAKKLEQKQHALHLSADEWMARVVGEGYDETKRSMVESMLWDIAARVLSLGVNVILDFGFWSRQERNEYKARATAIGAQTKLYFLDVPRDELLQRLQKRNKALPPDTFPVTEEQLDTWIKWFEPPTEDELQ